MFFLTNSEYFFKFKKKMCQVSLFSLVKEVKENVQKYIILLHKLKIQKESLKIMFIVL